MKALVVDDDFALADVVSFTLRKAGYEVIVAHDGHVALERWRSEAPDLIILDLNLPKVDGLSVCRQIRAQDNTPIIMLSVRDDEDDVVTGLHLGADDYIVKPFSPRQLAARVEAVLRRAGDARPTPGPLVIGDVTLDRSRRILSCKGKPLATLTQLECRLMEILMLNPGQVMLTDSLIDQVWGPLGGDKDMLKQLVYRLRQKLDNCPSKLIYIETVSGTGYSLGISAEQEFRPTPRS
ncbi:MAG: response regulator transcription factor [Chloroflexota bacterium]